MAYSGLPCIPCRVDSTEPTPKSRKTSRPPRRRSNKPRLTEKPRSSQKPQSTKNSPQSTKKFPFSMKPNTLKASTTPELPMKLQ